jgi:hypothetical protein
MKKFILSQFKVKLFFLVTAMSFSQSSFAFLELPIELQSLIFDFITEDASLQPLRQVNHELRARIAPLSEAETVMEMVRIFERNHLGPVSQKKAIKIIGNLERTCSIGNLLRVFVETQTLDAEVQEEAISVASSLLLGAPSGEHVSSILLSLIMNQSLEEQVSKKLAATIQDTLPDTLAHSDFFGKASEILTELESELEFDSDSESWSERLRHLVEEGDLLGPYSQRRWLHLVEKGELLSDERHDLISSFLTTQVSPERELGRINCKKLKQLIQELNLSLEAKSADCVIP